MSNKEKIRVLMVCMGNICRSPTAEGVFRRLVAEAGLADRIEVDSAGTHDYHIGKAPDQRAQQAARRRGIDLGDLRARMVEAEDFHRFDWILAMDDANMARLSRMQPAGGKAKLALFMEFAAHTGAREVPDPYYGESEGFELVLDLVEEGARGLLEEIRRSAGI